MPLSWIRGYCIIYIIIQNHHIKITSVIFHAEETRRGYWTLKKKGKEKESDHFIPRRVHYQPCLSCAVSSHRRNSQLLLSVNLSHERQK